MCKKPQVVAKINTELERVQDDRDNKKTSQKKIQKTRDFLYIVFLAFQIAGLYFTFAGEVSKK